MAKRGLKRGSKCVRKHRSGRCAKFSIPGGRARKSAGPKKRKGGGGGWAAVARAAKKQQEEQLRKVETSEPARTRGKFVWSEGKWSALSGGRRKRRRK